MMRTLGLLAILSTGCVAGLAPISGTEADADVEPEIYSVLPFYGDVAGGEEVTIRGAGLDQALQVNFGLEEAPFILQDNGDLLVYTPPADQPGAVDVRITTEKQTLMLPGGFEYTGEPGVLPDEPDDDPVDSDPPDTSGGGSGPPGQPGQTVGVVEVSFMRYACPDCITGRPNQPITQDAVAVFHDATDTTWNDWIPPVGTCDYGILPPVMQVNTADVGPTVTLRAPSYSLMLPRFQDPASPYPTLYDSGQLGTTTLQANTNYTLEISGGDWGTLSLPGAVQSVTPFTRLLPESMFLTDPDIFIWPMSKSSDVGFNWDAATSPGTTVIAQLDFYRPNGNLRNNIVCQGTDTGDMWIPASMLTQLVVDDSVIVTVYRFRKERLALPGGTELDVHYWVGREGTAYVAP